MLGSIRPRAPDEGFTVVEVIVAFAIASLSAAVLLQTFSRGFTTAGMVSNRIEAALIARSKLSEYAALAKSSSGRALMTEGREGNFTWKIETRPHFRFSGARWVIVKVGFQYPQSNGQVFSLKDLVVRP